MWIMEAVWPITALYFGPLALWAYYRWGRPVSHKWMEKYGEQPKKSFFASVAVGVSHCGAGCTLGDIIGSPAVFLLGLKKAGLFLWTEYIVDYVLAFILGIAFQYFSIKPMRGLSVAHQARHKGGLDPARWTPESLEAKPPERESICRRRVPDLATHRSSRLKRSS